MKYLILFLLISLAFCNDNCDDTCANDECEDGTGASCFACTGTDTDWLYLATYDNPPTGSCVDEETGAEQNLPRITANSVYYTNRECPEGYYLDLTTMECIVCHANCEACYGALETDCTECIDTLPYLVVTNQNNYRGSCAADCSPTGYFIDGSKCAACHSSCATCNDQYRESCLTCPEDYVKAIVNIDGAYMSVAVGYCYAECYNGAYDDNAEICSLTGYCEDGMRRSGSKCVPN